MERNASVFIVPLKGSPFLFSTSTVKLFLIAPSVVARWPSSGTGNVLTVALLDLGAVARLGDLAASTYKIVPCTELGDVDKVPSVPDGDWFFRSGFFFSGSTGLFATLFKDIFDLTVLQFWAIIQLVGILLKIF